MRGPVSRVTLIGAGTLALMTLLTIAGAIYTPYDPVAIDAAARLHPPNVMHLFGTDQYGRDVFSRVLRAGGVSLLISAAAVCLAVTVGALVGAIAGYAGGFIDRMLMLIVDAWLSMPGILFALAIVAVIGPNRLGVIGALALAYAPLVVRVVRGSALSIREKEYVEAARLLGRSGFGIIFVHVLPNCAGPLLVLGTSCFALALLAESSLSFLGLGTPPPMPSWGGMLADARPFLVFAPWMSVFPGIAILLTLYGVNIVGDWLRDRFDPGLQSE